MNTPISRRRFLSETVSGAAAGGLALGTALLPAARGYACAIGAPTAGPHLRGKQPAPVRPITREPGFHWFGYYDKHQFDATGRYALGMEVDFEGRSPRPDDRIVLGMVDREDGDRWLPLAESRAWCWQQGCMLQWLPSDPARKVIYNDRRDGRFVSVVLDVFDGSSRALARPVYCVSPDGRQALSVNFSRLHETRPGYGYAGLDDPWSGDRHPADDGIYLVDLETGEDRLVISLEQIAAYRHDDSMDGGKHWFNHLLFSPRGGRFIFLHRWHAGERGWRTRMFTSAPNGSELFCVADHGLVSHFIWRNEEQILAWSREPETDDHFHLYDDQTDRARVVGEGVLTQDGHCTFSPDGEWILTDTYPGPERRQRLMLYRIADGALVELGAFASPQRYSGEWRCDLHPRWSRDGRSVCIDSPHAGGRQMYLIDVGEIVDRGRG